VVVVRSANRERPQVSAPQRSGRMPFAGLSLGDPAGSPLRYLILAAGVAMLAFAALLVHQEKLLARRPAQRGPELAGLPPDRGRPAEVIR
jgi:hypothetical protein